MIPYFFFRKPSNGVVTPTILQVTETECGVAALAILMAYHGHAVSIEMLREACGCSRDGTSASAMIQTAYQHGFSAQAYTVQQAVIEDLKEPVIAYWRFRHYVVINGVDQKGVFINDPGSGPSWISWEEFDRSFTGIIITLSPISSPANKKRSKGFVKKIPQFIQIKPLFLFLFLGTWLVDFLGPFFYSLFCLLLTKKNAIPIMAGSACFTWLIVMTCLFFFIKQNNKKNMLFLENEIFFSTCSRLIQHLLRLPVLFFAVRQKGELVAWFHQMSHVFETDIQKKIECRISLMLMIVCAILMLVISPFLFLFFAFIWCLIFSNGSWHQSERMEQEKSTLQTESLLNSHALSTLKNLETIHSAHVAHAALQKWSRLFEKKNVLQKKNHFISGKRFFLNHALIYLSGGCILFLGGWEVAHHQITFDHWLSFYGLHIYFHAHFDSFFHSSLSLEKSKLLHHRFSDILQYPEDKRFLIPQNFSIDADVNYHIILKNVTFSYHSKAKPILEELSMQVKKGSSVALIGSSGSGKSTLAQLMAGLYLPTQGEVHIFEKNTQNQNPDIFSKQLAYVSQESSPNSSFFFSEHASLHQVDQVLEIVRLPKSILKKQTAHLSGGEKQRIKLAYALLQNTPILILDEATSALDPWTENQIMLNIRQLKKTVIWITHRLGVLEHMDCVWVLEKGRVVQHGSHQALIAQYPPYAQWLEQEAA